MSSTNSNAIDFTSRQEKSLGLLTSRFVSLLQDADDGVLDIKNVCRLTINPFYIYSGRVKRKNFF